MLNIFLLYAFWKLIADKRPITVKQAYYRRSTFFRWGTKTVLEVEKDLWGEKYTLFFTDGSFLKVNGNERI